MATRDRYQPVLDLGREFNMEGTQVEEKDGKLHLKGTVETQRQKDLIWDKIKKIGGEQPVDLMADIKVKNTSYYDKYTVQSGDSLSKIAKEYYGDVKDYQRIYDANRDQLDDPNKIFPGQTLTIPMPEGH